MPRLLPRVPRAAALLAPLLAAPALLLPAAAPATAAARATAPAAAPAAAASTGLEGVGRFQHVVVLTEENESATTTFADGSPAAYLRGLRSRGVFLPQYYGTAHASLDNYIAMVSGQPPIPPTMADCGGLSLYSCVQLQGAQAGGRNLADQLEEAGLSWKGYADGAPTPCFHAPYAPGDTASDPYQGNSTTGAGNYADRHVPFLYFPDVIGDQARCDAHQRPYTDLAGDLARDALPAFSFITPDTCHDGHDDPCAGQQVGGLTSADAWLRQQLPPLLSYLAAHDGLLVVDFDEGSTSASDPADVSCATCAGGGAGGRTGALLVSPRLKQGAVVTTAYDHYSLLRTVEDSFGISEHLGMAASATAMTDAFAGLLPPLPAPPAAQPVTTYVAPAAAAPRLVGVVPSSRRPLGLAAARAALARGHLRYAGARSPRVPRGTRLVVVGYAAVRGARLVRVRPGSHLQAGTRVVVLLGPARR